MAAPEHTEFTQKICTKCKLCTTENIMPTWCIAMYEGSKDRFIKTLKYISALNITTPQAFKRIRSFAGFCGLFCNTKPTCAYSSHLCGELAQHVECFTMFMEQAQGVVISSKLKMRIYELYSGVDPKKIGVSYIAPRKPLKLIPKDQRRKINKEIERAKASIEPVMKNLYSPTRTKKKLKKEPVTTFFCNDDAMAAILEAGDEADN